jgi:eukaryotic-like serine/threonine-protein kinase
MLCPLCHRDVAEAAAFCPYDGAPIVSPSTLATRKTGMAGAIVGDRFKIRGFLNKGATARVYLADDLETGSQVIVKLFAPSAAARPEMRTRFVREARLLMSISHANVVKVLSYGELSERPYVVTEALRGESLGEYLRREGAMQTDLALTLMRHAAQGLAAAHRADIVHRDVKPGNLFLVGPVGNPYGLKVIDFGMAKGEGTGSVSNQDTILGTIEYMAPEQIVADPVDARTDVYGLGVVMFRVFTGHLPFDVDRDMDLLAHQMFSPAPPPSWLQEGLDPRIERIILRAMKKRPENRYPSMDALLSELEHLLGLAAGDAAAALPEPADDRYAPRSAEGRQAAQTLARQFGAAKRDL